MSCNASMRYTITITDDAYAIHVISAWDRYREHTMSKGNDGHIVLEAEWDSAGWFDWAIEELTEELSTLPCPPEAWKLEGSYSFYDGAPDEDGCYCTFRIEDGEWAEFKEERHIMVDVEPWAKFELKGE